MFGSFNWYYQEWNKVEPKWNYHHFKKKSKKLKKKGKHK